MFLKSFVKFILVSVAITFSLIISAVADTYPSKSIKLIVPYGAGGGGDTTSRFIADIATDILGVKVIVENKTGGGGTIGIGAVAKSKPDGYTIGFIERLYLFRAICIKSNASYYEKQWGMEKF